MKWPFVLLSAITFITFSSCKKNYTCTCTGPIYSATSPATISTELGKMSRGDADAKCLEYSYDKSYTNCSVE
jgi:hypothetical protein